MRLPNGDHMDGLIKMVISMEALHMEPTLKSFKEGWVVNTEPLRDFD
jgi:hypothetical protein